MTKEIQATPEPTAVYPLDPNSAVYQGCVKPGLWLNIPETEEPETVNVRKSELVTVARHLKNIRADFQLLTAILREDVTVLSRVRTELLSSGEILSRYVSTQ